MAKADRDDGVPRLPAGYYLDHFSQVIVGVRARYGFLLTVAEREYLARLDALSEAARMLYARLVNRRGPFFQVNRLNYPEIDRVFIALRKHACRPCAARAVVRLLHPHRTQGGASQ